MLKPGARGAKPMRPARATALRVALAALALCALIAFARDFIGAAPPLAAHLEIISATSAFQPPAQLVSVPAHWLATFGALGLFWEHLIARLGVAGAPWLIATPLALALVWWILALLGEWRRPPLLFIALLIVQLWTSGFVLLPYLPPAQKLETRATALNFQLEQNGLHGAPRSPQRMAALQQAADECRAHGGAGIVFIGEHRLLPVAELQALRAANPDLLLLNGHEYRGDAHLIFVGLQAAITPSSHIAPAAISAAKKQGALVFAVPMEKGEYSALQWLRRGVDGFALSPDSAKPANGRALAALSTAGGAAWTLLPPEISDWPGVVQAVRSQRSAAAFVRPAPESPGATSAEAVLPETVLPETVLPEAARAAWRRLSRAQRVNVLLGTVVLLALLAFWGMGERAPAAAPGPQRVVGFLRRRRMGSRITGLVLMLLAWLGTLAATALAVTKSWPQAWSQAWPTPLYTLPALIVLALLYLYGRSQWRHVQ